jgi:hypothetical protein
MAVDKTSFLLYCDLLHTIEKMPDEKAGQLFKHILRYVNDLNPATEDLIIQLTFEPIRQQLKRDLKHWESVKKVRSDNGKKGGRPKKQTEANKANGFLEKLSKAKKAVNDNVNVNDSVSDNEIKRRIKKPFIKPELNEVIEYFTENGYNNISANKFYKFYDVSDWFDSKGKPVLNWKQKAQAVWFKDENKLPEHKKSKLAI